MHEGWAGTREAISQPIQLNEGHQLPKWHNGIISIRKNILCKHKKYSRYSHENHVTRMRCQNGLKDKKFKILSSHPDSGVIEKITLKSVVIFESRLFRII